VRAGKRPAARPPNDSSAPAWPSRHRPSVVPDREIPGHELGVPAVSLPYQLSGVAALVGVRALPSREGEPPCLYGVGTRRRGLYEMAFCADTQAVPFAEGRSCCWTPGAADWSMRPSSPPATGRWDSGRRFSRFIPPPRFNAAGCIRRPTSSTSCQKASSPRPNRCCTRFG